MRYALLVVASLSAAACRSSEPLGCSSNDACPAGHVCLEASCHLVCDSDLSCPSGFVCSDGVCQSGTREPPRITGVVGAGSENCPKASSGRCFADSIIVEGERLLGAAFRLQGERSFELAVADATLGTRARVLLPTDLVPGSYLLVAQNQAGESQAAVSILQGEPGPPGPDATGSELLVRLNDSGTVGRLVVDRMPVADSLIQHLNTGSGSVKLSASILPPLGSDGPSTGDEVIALINDATTSGVIGATRVEQLTGNELITRINSGTSTIDSARVQPHGGNTIVNQINSSTGVLNEARLARRSLHVTSVGTPSLIDGAALRELCADGDGCTISIGYRNARVDDDRDDGTPLVTVPAIWFGPPCRFHMDSARNWAISNACNWTYRVADQDKEPILEYYYRPYGSGLFGRDSDGVSKTVLKYAAYTQWVCILAEAPPTDGREALGTDGQSGFYFWMSSATDTGGSIVFDHPDRTCELVIQD